MRQNTNYKLLLLKEEKQDPRNFIDTENYNEEKENINSNIIVSNTLLDSLIRNDNEIIFNEQNNTFKDFQIKNDFTHHSLPMMSKNFHQQKTRLLSFSRKNSICSSTSVISNITDNIIKKNVNKNNNNENNNNLINQIENNINENKEEDFIRSTNTFTGRRNSCIKIISDVKTLYQNNFNCFNSILLNSENESIRKISNEPERILDAPNLNDNFFYNPLDWSVKNILSVCLGNYTYLWNYNNLETTLLTKNDEIEYCTSSFMNNGNILAIGLNNGIIELWDIEKKIKIRNLNGHKDRVGTLTWNNFNLFSGSKDTNIINHDIRIRNNIVMNLNGGHTKEICCIKWNTDFKYLASGGYDNLVCLWDVRSCFNNNSNSFWNIINSDDEENEENYLNFSDSDNENENINTNLNQKIKNTKKNIFNIKKNKKNKNNSEPFIIINKHKSAVRTLAWSPWQRGVLATGGYKKDNIIRFYNAGTKCQIGEYNTGFPICQLIWNKYEKEIISSHSGGKNSITVWSYPKMNKITELTGHLNRVLYMQMSPDGCTLVSGSSDETLRFWNINNRDKIKENNKNKISDDILSCFDSMMCIH